MLNEAWRYFRLFKQSSFGLNLPKGALLNYLKMHYGFLNEKIGPNGKTYPAVVNLYVTKRCNLNCSFCIFGRLGANPLNWEEHELTPKKFERILDIELTKKTLVFVFLGGEPLLNKDLPELVHMANKRKHLVSMTTNGLLLENRCPELFKSNMGGGGICELLVSIYDNTKEKLSHILPKVSHLVYAKASYVLLKSKLIESSKNDFCDLIDMIKMAKESGCKSLQLHLCMTAIDDNDLSETISQDDDSLYSQFIEACKNKLKGVSVNGYKGSLSLVPHKFAVFFQPPYSPLNRICMRPWFALNIDTNGNTVPCCRFQQSYHQPHCDNVFKDGEEIVNSPKAMELRKKLLDKNLPLAKECQNCTHINSSKM
jgi:radical SAM protein with 4Fe4S-binding SPASM domain